MTIVFEKENRLFTLCTRNSMYQMKADDKGILLHTYYGKKTEVFDYSYLIQRRDHGFPEIRKKQEMTEPILQILCHRNILPLEVEIIARVLLTFVMIMGQELWDCAMKGMRF